ncbi:MAG TPA: endonuclease domain-containing protein [Devosiaceae bacterium]|nr:endonuclease domain-containing protein [Devosiaceae bacterium]
MSSTRPKALRKSPTAAERQLWRLLYPLRTGGFHFRKQAPVGPYVADFACHHARLIVEVDGETHAGSRAELRDRRRDAYLRAQGYRVLRFSNAEVLNEPHGVMDTLSDALGSRPRSHRAAVSPSPTLPTRGRVKKLGSMSANGGVERNVTSPLVGEDGRAVTPAGTAAARDDTSPHVGDWSATSNRSSGAIADPQERGVPPAGNAPERNVPPPQRDAGGGNDHSAAAARAGDRP